VQNIARLDTYAPDKLGGISLNNSESFLGKYLVEMTISDTDTTTTETRPDGTKVAINKEGLTASAQITFTVIIAVIPVIITIAGAIVCIRRKYL
jgi:hypothetical protein